MGSHVLSTSGQGADAMTAALAAANARCLALSETIASKWATH